MISNARVIFLIDEAVEASLARSIRKLGGKARVAHLAEAQGLVRKPLRKGGAFGEDDHGHSHGHSHDHGEEAFDTHVWLDPVNAGVMARVIARTLSETDPINAAQYEANAEILRARLDDLTAQLAAELAPVRGKPFIVFHDACQYFEDRFGLTAVGSAVIDPGRRPPRQAAGPWRGVRVRRARPPSEIRPAHCGRNDGARQDGRSRGYRHRARARDVLQPVAQDGRFLQEMSRAVRLTFWGWNPP